jgi:3-dehydroquinate dehydratase-1
MSSPELRPAERAHVIGVANDAASLETAQGLEAGGGVDIVELRLDAFAAAGQLGAVEAALPRLALPLLITARHPEEGGEGRLPAERRLELLRAYLPHCRLVDLELRSSQEMPELISQARHLDRSVVLSYHDFRGAPRVELLEELAQGAVERGAHIFKAAVTVNDLGALRRLIRFAERAADHGPLPVAVMGMGRYGKISRLLLAQSGSVLNYGSLGGTAVPGQWDARVFAERLRELA